MSAFSPWSSRSGSEIAGFTPDALRFAGGRPQATWCRLGPVAFTDPFFDETVRRHLPDLDVADVMEADLEELAQPIEALPALEPTGDFLP